MIARVLMLICALFVAAPAWAEAPNLTGSMRKFKLSEVPTLVEPLPLALPDGSRPTLADYRGKLVLVNLWATWCAPCVKEMPSLQRLQQTLGGDDFAVLTISLDRGGAAQVARFFDQNGLTALPALLDPTGLSLKVLKARGLPTSVLIDREGREIGRMEGDAQWDTAEAQALVQHFLK
jgi:thiol-disulfide isomerase/thioredoxin